MSKTSFRDVAFGNGNDGFANLLCIKRREFSHENEVRLLVNDTRSQSRDGCYRTAFDYSITFEDICLDPRLNEPDYSALKEGLESLGCTLPITQSELYKVNFPPIRVE